MTAHSPTPKTGFSRRRFIAGGAAAGLAIVGGQGLAVAPAAAAVAGYNLPFTNLYEAGTVVPRLDDPYGPRSGVGDGFHNGIDFNAVGTGGTVLGRRVHPVRPGTIVESSFSSALGNYLTVRHADGRDSLYAHLQSKYITSGSVTSGSVLGTIGATGDVTGPHLHLAFYSGGSSYDPWPYLNGAPYANGAGTTPPPATTSEGVILQEIAQAGGYTGPVDGAPGTNTWLGVQQVMRGYGYTGAIDGAPGTNTYAALQRLAQKGGYTGPADGALGVNSWKGIQTVLRGFGYGGPIDGLPGTNTYAALQRLAKLGGYTGPADGVLGANSWKGVQKVLSGYGYTGPTDGIPGVNTYAALQRMAQLGGYTGPVDGIPGPNTWSALSRLI